MRWRVVRTCREERRRGGRTGDLLRNELARRAKKVVVAEHVLVLLEQPESATALTPLRAGCAVVRDKKEL